DRVLIEQSAQYRYETADVPSRPESELRTTEWFSAFSRIDANLSSRQSFVASGGSFPRTTKQATLGTITPPPTTADVTDQVNHVTVTERSTLEHATLVESTVAFHQYGADVHGQDQGQAPIGPMTLLPETTLGSFFNTQHRSTSTLQWLETISGSH